MIFGFKCNTLSNSVNELAVKIIMCHDMCDSHSDVKRLTFNF